MKKLFLFLMGIVIVCSFSACGNHEQESQPNTDPTTQMDQELNSELGSGVLEHSKEFEESLVGKSFVCGDYEYTIQENGTIFISGYSGSDSEITLPIELDGYAVTGVAERAFEAGKSLISLVIPGQIREIGDRAFSGCENLTSVIIENGVEIIGDRAFQNAMNNSCSISELSIPNSILKMGDHPFGISNKISTDINGLRYIGNFVVDFSDSFDGSIVFSDHTIGIADEALDYLYGKEITDETIIFPEGLRYIGSGAFAGQYIIKYFYVPDTVYEIGAYALHFDYVNSKYELYYSNDSRKIYGKSGSVAEEFAIQNGLNFVGIS